MTLTKQQKTDWNDLVTHLKSLGKDDEYINQAAWPAFYDKFIKGQEPGIADDLRTAITNIPSSAINTAKGMVSPLMPTTDEKTGKTDWFGGVKQTGRNLGKLALGSAELLIPGQQEAEAYPRAVGQFYKDRYGGLENIRNTFREDPVGMAADISTVLGTGGGLAKLGKFGKTADLLGKAETVTNPINWATLPFKYGLSKVPDTMPTGMLIKAYNMDGKMKPREKLRLTNLSAEYNTTPSLKSSERLQRFVDEQSALKDKFLTDPKYANMPVQKDGIINALENYRKEIEGGLGQGRIPGEVKARLDIVDQKLREVGVQGGFAPGGSVTMTAKEAQDLIRDIDKTMEPYYDSAKKMGQKAPNRGKLTRDFSSYIVRREANNELMNMIPELKDANIKMHDALDLKDAVDKALAKSMTGKEMGFKDIVFGYMMAKYTGSQEAGIATAIGKFLYTQPEIRAKIGNILKRAKKPTYSSGREKYIRYGQLFGASQKGNEQMGEQE